MCVPTWAIIIPLSASFDESQVVGGTGSPSTGSATILYDTVAVTDNLSWNVSWDNSSLLDTPTLMHFHGPAAAGSNAGVEVGIGVGSNLAIRMATINGTQASNLLAGLWYINVHTSVFNGGEIRGQVVPEPASLVMLVIGTAALVGFTRRRRRT